ncbi:hypothetical protein G6O67_008450 [Ophiocordyceps sinensis]|uniref:Uncharacterized protein n=1 Tax=Ophiocordyceps sinensis TaxID=72228 RepID=A0A8H4LRZ2_9HYPO|nr:hypothetical protein G6O67_008450 [Ophiocordyceps sinensis]
MKAFILLLTTLIASPIASVIGSPIGPWGPCAQVILFHYRRRPSPLYKIDQILLGRMDASACCSYGRCKKDVVISVGD